MDKTGKRLLEMSAPSVGCELKSIIQYYTRRSPDTLPLMYAKLGGVYTRGFLVGMSFALKLVEADGVPIDLDEVLYGWDEDAETDYTLEDIVRRFFLENPGYGQQQD